MRRAEDFHQRMLDSLNLTNQTLTKISTVQDNIATHIGEIRNTQNEHDDRIQSLENTRIAAEARKSQLGRIGTAGWAVIAAILGAFGFYLKNGSPPTPPLH